MSNANLGYCWYCYWGWPKKVRAILVAAAAKLDGSDSPLMFGPAHIVWEDENFQSVEWCLRHFEENAGDWSIEELAVVRWSLEELMKLSPIERNPCPENYDGENPGRFPPPAGVEMEEKP